MTTPRIAPISEPYEQEVAEELHKWMPPGAAVEPLLLFRTLMVNRKLMEAMRNLGSYILGRRLSLSIRERELIIDRTCARCDAEYEWGVHVAAFGELAGLTQTEIAATAERASAHAWSHRESLLIRAVDALHDQSHIPDDLWGALAIEWSHPEILEIVAIVGY